MASQRKEKGSKDDSRSMKMRRTKEKFVLFVLIKQLILIIKILLN